jgi:hypothetical protein
MNKEPSMSAIQEALKQERISCQFIGDYHNYNHGESAAFSVPMAHMLKQQGKVQFNEHKLRNDSGLMRLMEGNNNGMREPDVARIVEEKLEKLLGKNLEKIVAEQLKLLVGPADKASPSDSLPKSSIRK